MVKPHRVPESVFQVEFKLFEFMTIKQLVIVLITGGVAFLFYVLLNKIVSPFVQWLVVSITVTAGLIVSFVKFQGEPFEVYVPNFLIALISPQRRVWEKKSEIPHYLEDTISEKNSMPTKLAQQNLKETVPAGLPFPDREEGFFPQSENKLDLMEKEYLSGRIVTFNQATTSPTTQNVAQKMPSNIYSFKDFQSGEGVSNMQGIIWGSVVDDKGQPASGADVRIINRAGAIISVLKTNPLGEFRTGGVLPEGEYVVHVSYGILKYKDLVVDVSTQPIKPLYFVPITQPTMLSSLQNQVQSQKQIKNNTDKVQTSSILFNEATNIKLIDIRTLPKLENSFSYSPSVPVTTSLRGEVRDEMGEKLQGVYVIVRKDNNIIASTSTNQFGMFTLNNHLQNGEYVVELVKDGYWFNKYKLVVEGRPLEPKIFIGKRIS